jgi:hypothetical protein
MYTWLVPHLYKINGMWNKWNEMMLSNKQYVRVKFSNCIVQSDCLPVWDIGLVPLCVYEHCPFLCWALHNVLELTVVCPIQSMCCLCSKQTSDQQTDVLQGPVSLHMVINHWLFMWNFGCGCKIVKTWLLKSFFKTGRNNWYFTRWWIQRMRIFSHVKNLTAPTFCCVGLPPPPPKKKNI